MSNTNTIILEGRFTRRFDVRMGYHRNTKQNTAKTQSIISQKHKVKYRKNTKFVVLSEIDGYNMVEVML